MADFQDVEIDVSHESDITFARREARNLSVSIGFDLEMAEKISIAVSELASNLVRHATRGGLLVLSPIEGAVSGLRVTSTDDGPGIADVEESIRDGFSTNNTLGAGLGAVNRIMHEFDIKSQRGFGGGTHISCTRYHSPKHALHGHVPLEIGVATRRHPHMNENGDAFVIKKWETGALVGVIDGVGHGQFAYRAARTAQVYVEEHAFQPMESIFRGAGRACRGTRGVVMALARFDFVAGAMSYASVGNIEVHLFGAPVRPSFVLRRGIVGGKNVVPVVSKHQWTSECVLVLHSDGVSTRWTPEDFPSLLSGAPEIQSRQLLQKLASEADDATVLIVKGKKI